MRKILFISSHLFSGSDDIVTMLNSHPKIKIKNTNSTYTNPDDLISIYNPDPSIHCGDHLLHNAALCSKSLYDFCKFIYVIRPAKQTLNLMLKYNSFPKKIAINHYCFRIRRIYEMAKKTPGAVLLTWQDVLTGDWVPLVEEYTEISPLNSYIINSEEVPDEITPSDLKESEECYEKYLYRMKKMNLMINNV